jgi:perosamine synthetase
MIPLCEPVMGGKELEYITECIETGWVSSVGSYVVRFEKALADYVGTKYAVACQCGTAALHISLMLSGVEAGDEVIVPTVTFIATVNPVRYIDAYPMFVDCDEYCNIDVAAVRRFLEQDCALRDGATFNKRTGRRVAAIIPVHVFGTPVDMDPIMEMAQDFHLAVIEDATESLGSLYKGRKCGSIAPIGCLSFNGNKIVTSGGGGAIMTNDESVARRARYLTTQAKEDGIEYIHNSVGYNYRMNNVLAALGLAQLETLAERVAAKRSAFCRYEAALGPERMLQQPSWSESNRWFFGYLCADAGAKERLLKTCIASDIQVRPLWYPIHLLPPYKDMQAYEISRALWFYDRLVNLPCSVNITPEQIDQVVTVIRETGESS